MGTAKWCFQELHQSLNSFTLACQLCQLYVALAYSGKLSAFKVEGVRLCYLIGLTGLAPGFRPNPVVTVERHCGVPFRKVYSVDRTLAISQLPHTIWQ